MKPGELIFLIKINFNFPRLKTNGVKVAVKVQHKWLREQASGDINLVQLFIAAAEKLFPGFKYKVNFI